MRGGPVDLDGGMNVYDEDTYIVRQAALAPSFNLAYISFAKQSTCLRKV